MRENFTHMREDHAQLAPSIRLKAQAATRKGQFARWQKVGCMAKLRDSKPDRAEVRERSRMTYPGTAGRLSARCASPYQRRAVHVRADRVERPGIRARRDWTVCKASQVASMRRDAPRRALGSKRDTLAYSSPPAWPTRQYTRKAMPFSCPSRNALVTGLPRTPKDARPGQAQSQTESRCPPRPLAQRLGTADRKTIK